MLLEPENFGAWIKWLEYQQETGGRGRGYRDVNARQGWLGQPDRNSRARNAVSHANCAKSYCTFFIGHSQHRYPSLQKAPAFNRFSSFIHIPSDDFVTLLSWEGFFSELVAASGNTCKVLTALHCVQIPGVPVYSPVYGTYTPTYAPTYSPTYTPTVG